MFCAVYYHYLNVIYQTDLRQSSGLVRHASAYEQSGLRFTIAQGTLQCRIATNFGVKSTKLIYRTFIHRSAIPKLNVRSHCR